MHVPRARRSRCRQSCLRSVLVQTTAPNGSSEDIRRRRSRPAAEGSHLESRRKSERSRPALLPRSAQVRRFAEARSALRRATRDPMRTHGRSWVPLRSPTGLRRCRRGRAGPSSHDDESQDLIAVHECLASVRTHEAAGNASAAPAVLRQFDACRRNSEGACQFRGDFLRPILASVLAGFLEQPALSAERHPEFRLAAELLGVLSCVLGNGDDAVGHGQSA